MPEPDLYRNRDFVPDFDRVMEETVARSHAFAAQAQIRRDVPYGPSPRQRMDILLPPDLLPGAPVHMFVHGGYWRAGTKEAHTLVAAPVLAAGGIAAIASYELMPATRLDAIVAQVRAAAVFLQGTAAALGGDPARFTASGHSAGAHLVSLLGAVAPGDSAAPVLPDLKAMLLVSGIYDLSDIPGSFLRDEAAMTRAEAAAWSPCEARHHPGPKRIVTRGALETAPFHDQALRLHKTLQQAGAVSELREEADRNHLTIVLDLADPKTALGQCLSALVSDS